jgi:hypothetical protein
MCDIPTQATGLWITKKSLPFTFGHCFYRAETFDKSAAP